MKRELNFWKNGLLLRKPFGREILGIIYRISLSAQNYYSTTFHVVTARLSAVADGVLLSFACGITKLGEAERGLVIIYVWIAPIFLA